MEYLDKIRELARKASMLPQVDGTEMTTEEAIKYYTRLAKLVSRLKSAYRNSALVGAEMSEVLPKRHTCQYCVHYTHATHGMPGYCIRSTKATAFPAGHKTDSCRAFLAKKTTD